MGTDKDRVTALTAYREGYVQHGNASLESFEKATLTLFGLGLASSVGLAGSLLKDAPSIVEPGYLWISWVLMVVAILILLTSFLLTHMIFEQLTRLVDEQLKNPTVLVEIEPPKGLSLTVRWCNWISLILFSGGLVSFLLFAGHNLVKEQPMADRPRPAPTEQEKRGNPGYSPPPQSPAPPSPTSTSQPAQPAPTPK